MLYSLGAMKRYWIIAFFYTSGIAGLFAQLPNVSISPDFNFFDINGKQHHLYSYLSQGKVVILNFSPAWCQECWSYHKTNALKDFYTLYGPDGTDQARVIFIEKDEAMELSDLQGLTSATAGNWVDGTPYPIIDTSAANEDFIPDALPTIYGIYPNKFVFNIGKLTSDEIFDFVQAYSGPTVGPDTMIKVDFDEIKAPSCPGFDDGAIRLSVDGPGLEYSYAWNNGDTTQDISGLHGAIYRCTITDNLGNNHIIDPITLEEPDTLSLLFLQNTPTSETASNGSIIASINGGTPPYNFIWNTGATTDRLENIGEGTYSVQVIDANGCQVSDSSTLSVPDCSLVISINVRPTSCDENPDGEVNILVDGASPPLTFAWNNGATTQSLLNVPSGGYELTVTDAIGCMAIVGGMVEIEDQIIPTARIKEGPILLYLDENGRAEIRAEQVDSGSFDNCAILSMDLEQEMFDCSDIGRNFVEFTVIDNNLNLNSRDAEILVLDTITPVYECPEDITIAACDGIVNYSPPRIVDNCTTGSVTRLEGLGPGASFPLGTSLEKYTYTSGDGTRIECAFNVTVEKKIDARVETQDASCPGESDGSATVRVDSSTEDYEYNWSNGQNTQTAVGLESGLYSVTVSSINECTFVKSFFIGEPTELFIRLDSIKAPDGNGDIYISVLGGTPPYRYEWTNTEGIVSTVQDPKDLPFGTYQIRVKDSRNCETSNSIKADLSTDIQEENLLTGISLSPNPTRQFVDLVIDGQLGKMAHVAIRSIAGKNLFESSFPVSAINSIDVEGLPSGFYFVRIQIDDRHAIKRLVIQ